MLIIEHELMRLTDLIEGENLRQARIYTALGDKFCDSGGLIVI